MMTRPHALFLILNQASHIDLILTTLVPVTVNFEVRLDCDYFENKIELDKIAAKIIYTGPIDAYFDYKLGNLEYRSVRFENEILDKSNFQGNAAVNYTDAETPWTRIIEHKWFEFGKDENGNDLPKTVISREYSSEWKPGDEPYYPVNDEKNGKLYEAYKELASKESNVVFGGRLGEYKYYDMDQTLVPVTVNFILSPNMRDSEWIGWEISYCLIKIKRHNRTSLRNGVVAVIKKEKGSYSWFKCLENGVVNYNMYKIQDIIKENHFNSNPPIKVNGAYDWLNGSYIAFVEEDTFLDNPNKYINNAYEKSENNGKGYDLSITEE